MPKFRKGSPEAKAYMAKLRAMRGKGMHTKGPARKRCTRGGFAWTALIPPAISLAKWGIPKIYHFLKKRIEARKANKGGMYIRPAPNPMADPWFREEYLKRKGSPEGMKELYKEYLKRHKKTPPNPLGDLSLYQTYLKDYINPNYTRTTMSGAGTKEMPLFVIPKPKLRKIKKVHF